MAAVGAEAIPLLLDVLIDPESTAMQLGLASWALAFVGARAPEALRDAAASDHAEIRCAAIAALGDQIQSLADDVAKALVVGALSDIDADVRAEAATLLGKLHDPDWAAPQLEPLLIDAVGQVRKNAALSLMKLRASGSIPSLQARLDQENQSDVQAVLSLAINQLSNEDA
jgi:bilin biosynthesis protein